MKHSNYVNIYIFNLYYFLSKTSVLKPLNNGDPLKFLLFEFTS